MTVALKAGEMICRFERGELRPGYDAGGVRADKSTSRLPVIGMGSQVTIDPKHIEEYVGVVEINGKDLASLGFGVFPQAFALLDHKSTYMRIIGASALNSISGKNVLWYFLQPPWDSNGNQTVWALEAKKQWVEWYAFRITSELQWTQRQARHQE